MFRNVEQCPILLDKDMPAYRIFLSKDGLLESMDSNIRKYLEKKRKAKGLTQELLAEKINVSRGTYSSIVNGGAPLINKNLIKALKEVDGSLNEALIYDEKTFDDGNGVNALYPTRQELNSIIEQQNQDLDKYRHELKEMAEKINFLERHISLLENVIESQKDHVVLMNQIRDMEKKQSR